MTHIMLDLETWGTKPGCDLRSIGAVVFDPVAGYVNSVKYHPQLTFHIATENPVARPGDPMHDEGLTTWDGVSEYRIYPLHREPETEKWWNEQSEAARGAFANPVDLLEACARFAEWLDNVQGGGLTTDKDSPLRIWANDPHFDVSILAAVYDAVNLPVPWHYRAPRSMKTITEASGMTRDDYCNHGDEHNALHDAIAQAMTVCEAYKRLGLQR